MDPITIAGSFATIVGLIGMYRQEKGSREAVSYDDFVGWLHTHRHDQVVELIADNAALVKSVKAILGEQQQALLAEIGKLDAMLVLIAGKLEGLQSLADAAPATYALPVRYDFLHAERAKAAAELYYALKLLRAKMADYVCDEAFSGHPPIAPIDSVQHAPLLLDFFTAQAHRPPPTVRGDRD